MSAACCNTCDLALTCKAQYTEAIADCATYQAWLELEKDTKMIELINTRGIVPNMTFSGAKAWIKKNYPGRYFTMYYRYNNEGAVTGKEWQGCRIYMAGAGVNDKGVGPYEEASNWNEALNLLMALESPNGKPADMGPTETVVNKTEGDTHASE